MHICRKFFSFFILSAALQMATVSSLAQPLPLYDDVRLNRIHYENASGEKGDTYIYYDRRGAIDHEVWTLADSSRHSINYFVYDDERRPVEKYREFSDGLTSVECFGYNLGGRCIKETFWRSDSTAGEAQYEWNEADQLHRMRCQRYKGWLTADITFSYRNNVLIRGRIMREGRPAGEITYDYDAAGHLLRAHWDFNGRWSQTFTYDYAPYLSFTIGYSSPFTAMNPAFRVNKEQYDFNGEGGGPSHYLYSPEGQLTEKAYVMADGLKTVTSYVYRENGDLKSSFRTYSTGLTASFSYAFDHRGRLVERLFERSDGKTGKELYGWDRYGRLTEATYHNMDFWLNGVMRFEYDGWGRLMHGAFKGKDGYNATLQFKTDMHGNVMEIHWAFSFNKTQSYRLGYQSLAP